MCEYIIERFSIAYKRTATLGCFQGVVAYLLQQENGGLEGEFKARQEACLLVKQKHQKGSYTEGIADHLAIAVQ